jgi:hypothetical protein
MPVFPSVDWFQAIADLVNKDPDFKHHGMVDATMGVEVGDRYFAITFDGYEVTNVEEIDAARAAELDFTLVQSPAQWRAMLENIKQHGQAELEYTLNSLDLATPEEFARADDYYRRDLFYRYNQSFQHFFDASAKIDTRFEEEPARA